MIDPTYIVVLNSGVAEDRGPSVAPVFDGDGEPVEEEWSARSLAATDVYGPTQWVDGDTKEPSFLIVTHRGAGGNRIVYAQDVEEVYRIDTSELEVSFELVEDEPYTDWYY